MFTFGDRLTPANRIRKPSILLQYPILFYRLAEKAFLLLNKLQKISQQAKELMFPLDWQRNLIADGRFTVESDRATVVKLGEVALESAMVDGFSVVDQPMVSPKRRFFGGTLGGRLVD